MSIDSEISRIKRKIRESYDELDNFNCTIPTNKTIANLSSAINSITQTSVNIANVQFGGAYATERGSITSEIGIGITRGYANVYNASFTPVSNK